MTLSASTSRKNFSSKSTLEPKSEPAYQCLFNITLPTLTSVHDVETISDPTIAVSCSRMVNATTKSLIWQVRKITKGKWTPQGISMNSVSELETLEQITNCQTLDSDLVNPKNKRLLASRFFITDDQYTLYQLDKTKASAVVLNQNELGSLNRLLP